MAMKYKAYLFDVQGTLLDFFDPVRNAVAHYLKGVNEDVDRASELTRLWRSDYFQRVTQLHQSVDCWNRVQEQYISGFVDVCARNGIPAPSAKTAELVASSWENLIPWGDTRGGLARIRSDAITSTLSNTDMRTMVRLFKRLQIDWDAIMTAEMFGSFKPDPAVYVKAVRYLGVEPREAAMVASHPYDLRAASALGLGTVFVYRPMEYGAIELAHEDTAGEFDQRVRSILDIE